MRVLEVSLRKAGFTVTTAVSVNDALDKLELHTPDLIISETTFPDGDGFELPRRVRATPDWSDIPIIFLTAEGSIENKIRGLELGVDDYLTKPIYIKEIVTRINILLQKRQRLRFEERKDGHTRFAGRVADMPVVDVIQTIEISRKSGVIQFTGDRGRSATIYFRDGRVIDAEAGALQGEDAIYRLLTWNEGEFEVVFRTVRRREVITTSSQGLLMEGMRRLDEWSRLLEQLPALTHRFEVDAAELSVRLGDVPDDNNTILRLMDGKRTLIEIIDASDVGDLECLQAISRLYFEELLTDLDHGQSTKRITGQPMPLVEVETPTPIEDAASGPMSRFEAQLEKEHLDSEMERASDPNIANEDSVVDEAAIEEENPEPPGALLGGYRQSSLRLIDEAVAAAQAIEPSLFTDEELAAAGVAPARAVPSPVPVPRDEHTNGANGASARAIPVIQPIDEDDSIPHEIAADEPERPHHTDRTGPMPIPGRDDSGLRMIGSLGRDRAEASGELLPAGAAAPAVSETQRELVTILPRRVTREMPSLSLAEEPTPTILAPRPVTANEPPTPPATPRLSQPMEISRTRTPSMFEGSGVSRKAGPGVGPILLFILAALLGTIAVWIWVKKGEHDTRPVATTTEDAGVEQIVDATQVAMASDAMIPVDAAAPPADAPADAARVPPDGPPPYDKNKDAKKLLESAQVALAAGNFDEAIAQAQASLKLRKTVRAHHVIAQAFWKQGKIDDAIAAVGDADDVLPDHAPSWELRGRILWAAGRKDAARFAFEQFLLLQQDGAKADAVRELLRENK
jgi:DNA-binding response OmpR family regulator